MWQWDSHPVLAGEHGLSDGQLVGDCGPINVLRDAEPHVQGLCSGKSHACVSLRRLPHIAQTGNEPHLHRCVFIGKTNPIGEAVQIQQASQIYGSTGYKEEIRFGGGTGL